MLESLCGELRTKHFKFSEVRDKQIETKKLNSHIAVLSDSPFLFHHVYSINSGFKRQMPKRSLTIPVIAYRHRLLAILS